MAAPSSPPALLPTSLRLGRVAGIPIGLHFSWFIIAALITFSLAGHFRDTQPAWGSATIWVVAVLTAALFFVTLLAHELSHAAVARHRGLPVRSITLFALGGIANIEKEASSAKTEFLVAVVGPIVSLAIGFGSIAAALRLGWTLDNGNTGVAAAMLGWLGSINVVLAIFNLLPGYPLDGGRILRAILWRVYNDVDQATRTAARIGQIVAVLFIGWGLLQSFLGAGFGGVWLAFIGWFLFIAAQASYAQVSIGEALRGVRVGDVMADDCVTVDPRLTVHDLVEQVLLRTGRRCAMVRDDGRLVGLVTPNEVRDVERARWRDVTVGDVMRPLEKISAVEPATPVSDALRTMAREDINQLPVISGGRLTGIVSRAHIVQLLQSHTELKAS